ncbi:hypothetical protein KSS87_016585, partial [Heliosperma pusillum]
VDVCGWLEAFSAHPQIGKLNSGSHRSETFSQLSYMFVWSKGEQSTAMETATSTTLQELAEWNSLYKEKFGFVFLICASGRSTAEILNELKRRYSNRPITEFEIAAQEQMKITQLRLAKLFSAQSSTTVAAETTSAVAQAGEKGWQLEREFFVDNLRKPTQNCRSLEFQPLDLAEILPVLTLRATFTVWNAILSSGGLSLTVCLACYSLSLFDRRVTVGVSSNREDRLSMIGAHLASPPNSSNEKTPQAPKRTRPPITTHVLDVARGYPAGGIEVLLETWKGALSGPTFPGSDQSGWRQVGSGKTDTDGRSNPLMSIVDAVTPGVYRISFNTGNYYPSGFFPFVSIVFQITEAQKFEHFHVPLLLSPFGFSTYRGS